MSKFPCTHIAHWVTGPVYCCEEHAHQIRGLGSLLGGHVHVEPAPPNDEVCKNCENDPEKQA